MKFLDLNGLTHFFGKVKTWAGNNYLSLKGGSIDGSVVINNEEAVALRVLDGSSYSDKEVAISPTRITMSYTDEDQGGGSSTVYNLDIQDGNITANSFTRIGGTATQVLIANGSVREIGSANGIAGLDANGNVPLAQLGNLDTTVAEVVTALPTTNIKKHIYLIKDTDIAQNQYEEYIYTGDTSATYDASKWEKLGDFRATVDLADYAKKSEAAQSVNANYATTSIFIKFIAVDGHDLSSLELFGASSNRAGLMIASDKNKLDGIANNANNYSLPTASSTTKGGITLGYSQSGKNYPVMLDGNDKAYVNVPWTDTNTTYDLSPYAKKMETVDFSSIRLDKQAIANTPQGLKEKQVILFSTLGDNVKSGEIVLEEATSNMSGLMSIRDKNKLDYIANGATADSAITTAEIDALFA